MRNYPAVNTNIFTHVWKKVGTSWVNDIHTWKISFDPSATTEYRIRVLKSYLSDWNSLVHDLFLVSQTDVGTISNGSIQIYASDNPDHTLAIIPSNRRLVQFPGSNDPGDLEISDNDIAVTNMLNPGMGQAYKKMRLSSTFLSNPSFLTLTHVWIVVRFIGDYIKPESFDQNLHLTAQVEHKDVTITGNLTVNGTATLNSVITPSLTIQEEVQGNLFKTFHKLNTPSPVLASRELLTQKLFLRSSEILTGIIQNFSTTSFFQLGTTTNSPIVGVQSGVSGDALAHWNAWKDLPITLALYGKVTEITQFNGNNVTYNNGITSPANIQHAISFQYNPFSRTWQAGLIGDPQEYSPFTGAELIWHSDSSNYVGPRLRGNLPFILRSKNLKSSELAGRILFFNSTPGYEDLVDINPSFRVQGAGDGLFLSIPNFSIQRSDSTFENSVEISRISINKPQSIPNSNLTPEGSVVFYSTTQDNNLTPRYSYGGIQFHNETLSLSLRAPSGVQEFYNPVNTFSVFQYNADYDLSYDTLNIGNTSQNVYMNLYGSRFSVPISLTKIGVHSGTNYFYGQTFFFSDDTDTSPELSPRGNEGSVPKMLVLRNYAPAPTSLTSPLIQDSSLVPRLSTNGTIHSPTIDHIWMMVRSLITSQGTVPLNNETNWWGASSSIPDNTLYTELSSINSQPLIGTYTPSPINLSSKPLTLRELEILINKVVYNVLTLTQYTKSRKVDKGILGNHGAIDDYGSLWQLHKDETPYDGTLTTADNSPVSRSDVYLAADGTWKYLFDEVLLAIKDE